ncbi:MAG: 4-hydroxy-tetrahydrodipicolinate synthase [Oscillospiraceae bacterium]|jgi:4-hydroxy-tetrahydrodipicolinate synthase|nr:4-hydroxy-tetrahydrodipicolinate synthase [Oscillospiraceae bacterium]
MKKTVFKGSGCAIATPFNSDGSINFEAFENLINFQIENKTDAIVVMGTTGEASTLNDADHLRAIEFCVEKVAKRVPVVAGCGSNDTAHAVALSKKAQALGADALLHVTPYYNKTSQRGLVRHFMIVAEALDIPVILYNVPSRTGLNIRPASYLELSGHENIVAVKEANGDISSIVHTAAICGSELGIYSGNDDQVVPVLSMGGLGVISVVANVAPKAMHDLCALYFEGKTTESSKAQADIIELNDALFCDVNPIPVKHALNLMGMNAGAVRLPLLETTDKNKELIKNVLEKYKLI